MPTSRFTGHDFACEAYATIDESDCTCHTPMTLDDGPEYAYSCTGSIMCEPILDQHGRECERVNDEARGEFYADVARAALVDVLGVIVDDKDRGPRGPYSDAPYSED